MSQKIYLGPTMSGRGLTITTGSIYNGPLPPEISERQTRDPDFAALFVVADEVGAVRAGIRNGDSFVAQCYQNVYQKYINSKRGV